ncbi:MAG: glycosyltransferase family 2 protein [Candidatus Aminicenantales bacterium]
MSLSFSAVIPLYNKGKYIDRAVTSVMNQSHRDFELLIINDGSTDGGDRIASGFKDPRIRLFHQENRGVSAARNAGIEKAKNDYIAFLDADDEWDPRFLAEIEKLIVKYPDAGLYGTNHKFKYPDGRETIPDLKTFFPGNETDGYIVDYFGTFSKYARSPFSNSGCCMPKAVLLGLRGYKPGVALTEDSDLWCRIALEYPIAFSVKPLCTYSLDVPDGTGSAYPSGDYEVSRMLQGALEAEQVPDRFLLSVRKMIAFLQVSRVKRALLLARKQDAFRNLADRRIILRYPRQWVLLSLCALLPHRLLVKLNAFRRRNPLFSGVR